MTDNQLEYIKSHPSEPMNSETFAECVRMWHERGEPTQKNLPTREAAAKIIEAKQEYWRKKNRERREAVIEIVETQIDKQPLSKLPASERYEIIFQVNDVVQGFDYELMRKLIKKLEKYQNVEFLITRIKDRLEESSEPIE